MNNYSDLLRARAEHLEKYAAAFIKEVGSEKASEYQLVEDSSEPFLVTWRFEKIQGRVFSQSQNTCFNP